MQTRILDVLVALSTGRGVRAADLAVRLGTSERTIRRDIAQLREEGYRIDSAPGVGGGYVAPTGLVLPPLQFTPDEAFTLALALRTLAGQGLRDPHSDVEIRQSSHVESSVRKLRSVLPAAIVGGLDRAADSITAVPGNEPEVPLGTLVALASAVAERHVVDLEYRSRGQDSERRVEPYRIVVFGGHWYLLAWDLTRQDWRTFRLDRIISVHTTTFGFRARTAPDAVAFVRDQVSQVVYRMRARVRVHAPASEVSQRVPARAGSVTAVAADECELLIGADQSEWLIAFLLHLGHRFTVVEPDDFRMEVLRLRDLLTDSLQPSVDG